MSASPYRASVADQFWRIVTAHPDAVALIDGEREWTYATLLAAADVMARRLTASGVEPGDPVVFALPRTTDAVLLQLAILLAGGAYVPLDPAAPPARWARQLSRLDDPVVIATNPALSELAGSLRLIAWPLPDTADVALPLPTPPIQRDDVAYVMFTSGSTGEPKGVLVPQRGILRLVCDVDYVKLGPGRRLLQAAPHAFDAATFEIWGAWLTGACLVMHPEPIPTPHGLGETIRRHGVTTAWLTAGLFNAIVDEAPEQLAGLDELLIGGEALSVPHVRTLHARVPGITLINGYGPTETTTFAATYRIPNPLPPTVTSIPIGTPIPLTTCTVIDDLGRPLPAGGVGELWIGGDGVALGYAGAPELTTERFVPDGSAPLALRYRTGDRVRQREDGLLEYVGRLDTQLKIGGHRIEPTEIEQVLGRHEAIAASAVVPVLGPPGQPMSLAAWLVLRADAEPIDDDVLADALRALVRAELPPAMVPSSFHRIDALPLTPNGKVNRASLAERTRAARTTPRTPPAPARNVDGARSAVADGTSADAVSTERRLREVFEALLGVSIAPERNLFDQGVTSLLVVRATARLAAQYELVVPPVLFFEHPSIRAAARALVGERNDGASDPTPDARLAPSIAPAVAGAAGGAHEERRVAIVAAAVRFPGGVHDLASYWRLLTGAEDGITRFGLDGLDDEVSVAERTEPGYVAARGVLDDVAMFDAAAFGVGQREAQLTDPQQRLWLELAWEALDRAGLNSARETRRIGVYGGVYNSDYLPRARRLRPEWVERYGAFNAMLLNEKDYVATRVAHRLGLRGPAISVHTACSTSLVATCLAVQALRDGQCDVALAGGVSLTLPTRSGYLPQEGGMLSADGVTRPFDARASGTVFSDGAAVLVLKRLDDAIADGDDVLAVIRGIGLNNDGAGKASFTAPSVPGQAEVIARALADAGLTADAVSLVEAHGTATPLGDPIEVEALRRVYGATPRSEAPCRLGSVKGHIGHTVIAAGAAGVLKAALAMRHEQVPGTAHFTTPNPQLALERSPFHVHATPEPWPRGVAPRVAAVSSFGVGGTNAHVILEEPPAPRETPTEESETTRLTVLRWSARTEEGATAQQAALAAMLTDADADAFDRVVYSVSAGRTTWSHRRAVVATSVADARSALTGRVAISGTASATPSLTMLIPGQGAQRRGMGRELYEQFPAFRDAFDRCARVARDVAGLDLRDAIDDGSTLESTAVAQPALFATAYALASLWLDAGVRPDRLIGHSVGEFVAAAIAGVFSVDDAMRLVCKRGALMWGLPRGRMLAVPLDAETLMARIPAGVDVAAVNGPSQCVLSGSADAIAAVEAMLAADGIEGRALPTSHAFHSAMMDPVLEEFGALVREIPLAPPTIPIISSVTGAPLSDAEATDAAYWTRHLRVTVRFDRAIATALDAEPGVCLEVGPGATLTALSRRQQRGTPVLAVASLLKPAEDEATSVATAGAQLWCWGRPVSFEALQAFPQTPPPRVDVAPAPLDRHRLWVDPVVPPVPEAPTVSVAAPAPPVSSSFEAMTPSSPSPVPPSAAAPSPNIAARRARLRSTVCRVVEDIAGTPIRDDETGATFQQLGLDSLVLTQVALALSRQLKTKLTFRQLLESTPTVDTVVAYLDATLPPDAADATATATGPTSDEAMPTIVPPVPVALPGALPATPAATPAATNAPTDAAAMAAASASATASATSAAPNPSFAPPPRTMMPTRITMPAAPMFAAPMTSTGLASGGVPVSDVGTLMAQQLMVMQQVIQQQLLAIMGGQYATGAFASASDDPGADGPPPTPAAPTPNAPAPTAPTSTAPTSNAPTSNAPAAPPVSTPVASNTAGEATAAPAASPSTAESGTPSVGPNRAFYDASKAFGAAPRITVDAGAALPPRQRARLDAFIRRYTSRTAGSKRYTEQHRAGMADPRAVTGFRPLTKELVYPIVVERSEGARVWDVDGNEYIDVLCGFGSCLLGWTAPPVVAAVQAQLAKGFEVGPQHVLAGEVADRLRAMVRAERVALCNTGSEAVLGAIRIARTVTGRPLVAAFTGSYHGINDEVIVRAGRSGKAMPAAPGIMAETAQNMMLLDYGTPESLAQLEARADDIAAILIEPVQSRRPDFQPIEFLQQLRELCTRRGILCIWDEIVTGFRAAPGGAQELFGITPDLSTFGKIVGGGLPIGVIAGKAEFMDALDGGPWQYGDDSVPTVGVTYFAGTFVRHPLALAAARAMLDTLAAAGPSLQQQLTARTTALAAKINARAQDLRVPLEVRHFASVWRPVFTGDVPFPDLFFYAVRDRGIHLYEGFPCFLTAAHGDAECEAIVDAFGGAMEELQAAGFLPGADRR